MGSFDSVALGVRVKSLRRERKLTQAGLAECAGVTDETVSRVERGAFEPSVSTVVALALALQTSPDVLLGSADKRESVPQALPPFVQRLIDLVLALDVESQAVLLRMAELLLTKRKPDAKVRQRTKAERRRKA